MSTTLPRPATSDGLLLWVLHRFAEVFEEHAIVKGGIALRLHDCPRATNDVDYVFVPFRSKNDILGRMRSVLQEIEGADLQIAAHSKMVRARLRVDGVALQIEANVDLHCPSIPVPTAGLAIAQGQPSRLVRVMDLACALAHKLAAWNERRLLRDLYDVYFLAARLGATPDLAVLDRRLARIESRLPQLARRKHMTRAELAAELRRALDGVDDRALRDELAPVLPPTELAGLLPRLRGAIVRLAEQFEVAPEEPPRRG
ncbi:MAG: nucleotidyl transferase AbiEii/AbiGii toxin family protein [Planctomycetes bacterium]|nr:nucleotidyl transferase AbiEii/AbiGii toxin family protein [Planctomycetota bacterium]